MASFGENLRRAREARNITLQEIAASTKISTRALQALENEHFDQLPGGIFNRGFVRSYARCVGLDEENAVAEYLAAAKVPPPELDMQTMSSQVAAGGLARRQGGPNAATVVGVLAVIVALGLGAMWLNGRRKEAREQAAQHQAEVLQSATPAQPAQAATEQNTPTQSTANAVGPDPGQSANQGTNQGATSIVASGSPVIPGATPSSAAAGAPGSQSAAATSDATAPVQISISASARSWISVHSDGKTVESLTLDPAKPELRTRSYTAKDRLTLEVGNPGALSVTYNGRPAGTLGPSGQKATVTFTPEGIEKQ